jgi:hypothetical protein
LEDNNKYELFSCRYWLSTIQQWNSIKFFAEEYTEIFFYNYNK